MESAARRLRAVTLAVATSCLPAPLAEPAAAQSGADRPIEVRQVRPGVHLVSAPPGGTVLVLTGPGATLMVDAEGGDIATRIDSVVAALGRAPIRWVINTHYHEDHIGGNAWARRRGAVTIAHPAARRLAQVDTQIVELQWHREAAAPEALPSLLAEGNLTIHHPDGEEVRVVRVDAAHTGGDLVVHLLRANVLHTGDIVELGAYPFVDWWGGGTLDGMIAAVDRILAVANDDTIIVPGHGAPMRRDRLATYRTMLVTVRDHVARGIAAGQTIEQILASRITAPWDAEHGGARQGEGFVRLVHFGLGRN